MDDVERTQVVAIIGTGEMGAAVGQRMLESGARVVTSLRGRSVESRERVRRAGLEIVDDDDAMVNRADFVLSIVPPAAAVEVAERLRAPLARSATRPVFAECNAISPKTVNRIEQILASSGCRFVDAGIIGGPPSGSRSTGPRFYVSGADAKAMSRLSRYGLDIAVMDGPIGAASGLKLSYAGLTKGLTALGAAMIAGASRAGLGGALRAELLRTQPDLITRFERHLPGMLPKAYRWVAEMGEIAEFLGGEEQGAEIYAGAARLYERIAREFANNDNRDGLDALLAFCKVAPS
jgi:L-threonate 2-dehydrogenase